MNGRPCPALPNPTTSCGWACAGRGGSCELMVGCLARAASEELLVDYNEMEEVRWVRREGESRQRTAAVLPVNSL